QPAVVVVVGVHVAVGVGSLRQLAEVVVVVLGGVHAFDVDGLDQPVEVVVDAPERGPFRGFGGWGVAVMDQDVGGDVAQLIDQLGQPAVAVVVVVARVAARIRHARFQAVAPLVGRGVLVGVDHLQQVAVVLVVDVGGAVAVVVHGQGDVVEGR